MKKKGLTLIECLISLILLAVLLVAGIAFYFYAQETFRWSVHKRIAIEMASAEMESIKNMEYTTLPNPPSRSKWFQESGPVNIVTLNDGQRDVYVTGDGATGYKEAQVEVSWQDPARGNSQQSVSLDTYIAR